MRRWVTLRRICPADRQSTPSKELFRGRSRDDVIFAVSGTGSGALPNGCSSYVASFTTTSSNPSLVTFTR